jgi:hypothetical protein
MWMPWRFTLEMQYNGRLVSEEHFSNGTKEHEDSEWVQRCSLVTHGSLTVLFSVIVVEHLIASVGLDPSSQKFPRSY